MNWTFTDGVLRSFLFGITVAAAVGPIALLIVNYGISKGFRAAFAAGCGAATADLLYALLAFMAGAQVSAWLEGNKFGFQRGSSLLLVLLGFWMLWRACSPRPAPQSGTDSSAPVADSSRPFLATLVLTIVNPLTVLIFVGFAGQLPLGGSLNVAATLALAVFLGSLLVQSAFALGGAVLAGVLTDPRRRLLNGLSGAGIAVFGLVGFFQ